MMSLSLLPLARTVVDYALEAVRDADWKANTYGIPYAITYEDERFVVKALSLCNNSSEIIEICHATQTICSQYYALEF